MTSRPAEQPEAPPNPSIVIPFSRDADFKCAISGSRTALVGLGGVGKLQLAIEYAYRTRDRSPETWVFWVHASNAARFEQSFRDIANYVKISGRKNPQADILQLVHDWLRDDKGKWVLILDNVDEAGFLVEARRTGQDGQTSGRESGNLRPLISYFPIKLAALQLVEDYNLIAVEPIDKVDAVALDIDGKDCDVSDLAAALEYMPFAIFRKSGREKTSLLDNKAGHLRRDREAKNSIIITWHILFEHIRRERDKKRNGRGNEFEDDLLVLRDYAFIFFSETQSAFEMHALVQLVIRTWLEVKGDLERWRRYYSQKPKEQDFLLDWALVLYKAASYALSIGKWVEAETMSVQAMKVRKKILGNEHNDTLDGMAIVGLAYELKGKYKAAEPLYVETLRLRKKVLGQKHPSTLASMSDLAVLFQKQGKYNAAEPLYVETLQLFKKILGQEHPSTLASMNNLALLFESQRKYEAAEPLFVETLRQRKKVLGQEHPDTLASMNNLALLFESQGKYQAAEPLYVETLLLSKKILGQEHPSTLANMNNLALLFESQRKYEAAEPLYVETLRLRKKVLGQEHPNTLGSINNLACLFQKQGKYEAAEPLFVETLRLRKKVLGQEHPDTLASMNNLALLFRKQGKDEAARA
ncbi:TPR-like protein [Cadophora sp. DSE1049]|nr:TPR-like protein [Cadophora sp. DSE1049]